VTDAIDATFSVSFTHRLRFARGIFDDDSRVLGDLLAKADPPRVVVFVDGGLAAADKSILSRIAGWGDAHDVPLAENPTTVTGGEAAKADLAVAEQVVDAIEAGGLCRRSCVLAVGGGAMLDAVGLGASLAHRGVRLLRIPSTTLSQCDSGVGVKNGINRFAKKNFIGVFDPPMAVVNDLDLLETLDDRHWRSGLSEAVKVSLVKDASLFHQLEADAGALVARDASVMERVIRRSAQMHLEHIVDGGDPFERSESRPLDFGHWSAHKLEQVTDGELTHGEAVSVGLAIDVEGSVELGLLERGVADRVLGLLAALGLPTTHRALADVDVLHEGVEEFREHLGGALTLLLLQEIGSPVEVHELDVKTVRRAIERLV
jgi:3-dehydroquinate synthase